MNPENVVAVAITGVLTYLGTRLQVRGTIQSKKVESEANTEGIYVENMSVILSEYQEQVSSFRKEISVLKDEFAQFKQKHYKEVREYKELVDDQAERIDELEVENGHLIEENTELKIENTELKEGKNNNGRINK